MPPIVPISNVNPYPTVKIVLHRARQFALDAGQSMDGDLLASTQPYMPDLLNSAWERLQDDLIDAGVETLSKQIVIANVPPVYSTDPSISVWLAWDGYCNGQNTVPTPNLPNDMILPRSLAQRVAGSGGGFCDVHPDSSGLQGRYQNAGTIGSWEWREDKIVMNGSTGPMDLRLDYTCYLPYLNIADQTQVPIMRCANALGYCVAAQFAEDRGGTGAVTLRANAVREISRMTNRTARRKAVVEYRRRPFGR